MIASGQEQTSPVAKKRQIDHVQIFQEIQNSIFLGHLFDGRCLYPALYKFLFWRKSVFGRAGNRCNYHRRHQWLLLSSFWMDAIEVSLLKALEISEEKNAIPEVCYWPAVSVEQAD